MSEDKSESTPRAQGRSRRRVTAVAAAVGAAGLVAGGLAAAAISVASADAGSTASQGYAGSRGGHRPDPSASARDDEKLLTGSTRTKVLAAVEEKYPDATVHRVETDSDGVYEAHILDDGTPLIVQLDEDFEITGTQTGGPGGPGGHRGDGQGPGGQRGDLEGGEGSQDAPSAGTPENAVREPVEPVEPV